MLWCFQWATKWDTQAHIHNRRFLDKTKILQCICERMHVLISIGPHSQTHSPNINVLCTLWANVCVWRTTQTNRARDIIATGDSMSMWTFFTCFTWNLLLLVIFFLLLTHQYCVLVLCCVCTESLVVLNIIFIFFSLWYVGPLKISNVCGSGSGKRHLEWESTSFSIFNCRQLVSVSVFDVCIFLVMT